MTIHVVSQTKEILRHVVTLQVTKYLKNISSMAKEIMKARDHCLHMTRKLAKMSYSVHSKCHYWSGKISTFGPYYGIV